jgi:hypothetical protein
MSFASMPHPESAGGSDDRLNELLIERALWGLDDDRARELEAAAGMGGWDGNDSYDLAVASLAVVFATERGAESVPESVRRELSAAGRGFVEGRRTPDPFRLMPDPAAMPRAPGSVVKSGFGGTSPFGLLGWFAAAACLAFAMLTGRPAPVLDDAQRLALLERTATDLVRASWVGLGAIGAPAHPLDHGVSGVVVWSDERDEGYMLISGIEPNDPSHFQYQLWIFDADRPTGDLPQFRAEGLPEILTQRPVDGGVFDVTELCEVTVPIRAKLPVGRGVLFAVTREPPGGVVVSDRDIVFLALKG